MIRCPQDYFSPIIDYLHKAMTSEEVLHCDETPIQVLKEDGKKPQSKSYMWLYRTTESSSRPIILYDYKPSRSGDNARRFLKNFKGYLHTDGYSGYNKLENITRCGCWHIYGESLLRQFLTNRIKILQEPLQESNRITATNCFT